MEDISDEAMFEHQFILILDFFGYDINKYRDDEIDVLIELAMHEARMAAKRLQGKKINEYGMEIGNWKLGNNTKR